jgi:predicted RNA binding protein YcfA (HicA-like mRNA interferase family)
MKRLPGMNAKEVIRILKKFGFEESRQRGSHLVLFNPATNRRTVVPVHAGKDVKKPLLRRIIEDDVGVSIEEFLRKR